MNIALIILAIVCLVIGALGSVLPVLPGPPLAWVGLLIASFTPYVDISTWMLVVTAVMAVVIGVIDYVVPSLSTKRFGGSKYGIWGCNIGLIISIIGLPFGPQGVLGVMLWPFIGALVGEYLKSHELRPALKAATGAFVGFLGGTFIKTAYCLVLLAVVVAKTVF